MKRGTQTICAVVVFTGIGSAMAVDIETVRILPIADGTTYYDHRDHRISM